MAGSRAGQPIVVDVRALRQLARDLRAAAPELWKEYRIAARAAMEPVAEDARSRSSYSTRIPGSIRVRTTAGGNVKVIAGGEAAPDAAAIENRGKGFVRHKTFGREPWTTKNSHPAFLTPAFEAHAEEVADAIEQVAVDVTHRAIGS